MRAWDLETRVGRQRSNAGARGGRGKAGQFGARFLSIGSGVFAFLALGLTSVSAAAAPTVDAPRSGVTTITCSIGADGKTTCGVSQGRASVCARRTGGNLEKAFQRFTYLDEPKGCTLNVLYWREHGPDGTAPIDPLWDGVGSEGPKTPFFNSGLSFREIFQAPAEDAYKRMAQAFIVAELNRLNGATMPESVMQAYDEATVFLISQDTDLDPATAARFDELAAVLERFNAGETGSGQCLPLSEPLDSADVGKTLMGTITGDTGVILSVADIGDAGEGRIGIEPRTPDDLFLSASEPFLVNGVRKARFTQEDSDCLDVDSGEEIIVEAGRLLGLTSDDFLEDARALQVLIAINAASEEESAPEGGAEAASASEGDTAGPGTSDGGFGDAGIFPSTDLPPTKESSGAGGDLIPVPNVIGQTLPEAEAIIVGDGLRVGTVTVVSQRNQPTGPQIMRTAYAEVTQFVSGQSPPPGTLVEIDTTVNLEVTEEDLALSEPSSFAMLVLALMLLGGTLWWRRRNPSP
jgi:hypothetical protein